MKEDLNKQDEALEALLKTVEAPKAPGWFEARTMSRLRRERAEAPSFGFKMLRYLGVGAVFAILALVLGIWMKPLAASDSSLATQAQLQDEQLFAALDAFDSYTRQAKEWNQEPYQ